MLMHRFVVSQLSWIMKETLEKIKDELKKHPNGILITELAKALGMTRTNLIYHLNRHLKNEYEKLGKSSSHYPIRLRLINITSLAGEPKTPAHSPTKVS